MVRGRDSRPGFPERRGRWKKGGPEEPRDHALGRSQGGFGTKLHLVASGNGVGLGAHPTAGQDAEITHVEEALEAVVLPYAGDRPELSPAKLAGDKAYSAHWIRIWLQGMGILPVIPHRSDEHLQAWERPFDRRAYRKRNIVERLVGWLKECRRIGTRFEKLAVNYMAMVKLALIERCLKVHFSDGA